MHSDIYQQLDYVERKLKQVYTPFQLFKKSNFPLTGSASYDVGY